MSIFNKVIISLACVFGLIGGLCNFVVIKANNNRMPVEAEYWENGFTHTKKDYDQHIMIGKDGCKFRFLADRYPIHLSKGICVFSIGDFFLYISLAMLIISSIWLILNP